MTLEARASRPLVKDAGETPALPGRLPHRLDHFADLAEYLPDLVLAHDEGRAQRDGVAGDADHDALLVERPLHGRVGALAEAIGLGREVDAGDEADGADVGHAGPPADRQGGVR